MNVRVGKESEQELQRLFARVVARTIRPGQQVKSVTVSGLTLETVEVRCAYCGDGRPEHFRLNPEIVRQYGIEGIICIACAERLVGRRLTVEDLDPGTPANRAIFHFVRSATAQRTAERIMA